MPAPSGDDLQQDLEGTVNWQVQLKEILWSSSETGFEHLCAAIMTAMIPVATAANTGNMITVDMVAAMASTGGVGTTKPH